jgi:hypothetical protein
MPDTTGRNSGRHPPLEMHAADAGYELFQFTDISVPGKWDSFFSDEDFAELIADCHATWGISPDLWESIQAVQ